jgi:3'-phosphoadenosine 5'-phosphosulfate (PAPS) 3'-phosphatase
VCDQQHGGALAPGQAGQQRDNAAAAVLIKVAGGLIGQQQGGPVRQGAGNGGTLLLPAGSKNSSVLRYQHLNSYCPCHNAFVSCLK